MSRTLSHRFLQTEFLTRCRGLGVIILVCSREGEILEWPDAEGVVGRWFCTRIICDRIQETIQLWLRRTCFEQTELFEGCWLVPVVTHDEPGVDRLVVGMVLGQSALSCSWFERVCVESSLDLAIARGDLGSLARYQSTDIELLTQSLRWSCNDLEQIYLNHETMNQFSENLVRSYEESHLLFKLARQMNGFSSPSQAMESVSRQVKEVLPFGWIVVHFGHSDAVVSELRGVTFLSGDWPCDEGAFASNVSDLLNRCSVTDWSGLLAPNQDSFARLMGSEVVVDVIAHDSDVVGLVLAGGKAGPDHEVSSVEMQFLDAVADLLSVFHENMCRFEEQREMFLGTLGALTASIDAKDRYTRGHSDRVALMGASLARAAGMDDQVVERVRISGLVHDVGKIGIRESVLCKCGQLTVEEFKEIKKHPMIGYHILKDIPPMRDVLPGVLYHHERWDGGGYPEGLSGTKIPLFGRILAVADAFDAMSSDRSYRAALRRDRVLDEICQGAGSQFDPSLAELFVELDMTVYDRLLARHREVSDTMAA